VGASYVKRTALSCPGKKGITVGTNKIFYLIHADIKCIPKKGAVTYAHIVIGHHPQKEDPTCVHIIICGNLIDYPFELTTRTANIGLCKIMWNSVLSMPGAKIGGANSKNMCLKIPLIDMNI
jgi:hypothetical protein